MYRKMPRRAESLHVCPKLTRIEPSTMLQTTRIRSMKRTTLVKNEVYVAAQPAAKRKKVKRNFPIVRRSPCFEGFLREPRLCANASWRRSLTNQRSLWHANFFFCESKNHDVTIDIIEEAKHLSLCARDEEWHCSIMMWSLCCLQLMAWTFLGDLLSPPHRTEICSVAVEKSAWPGEGVDQ